MKTLLQAGIFIDKGSTENDRIQPVSVRPLTQLFQRVGDDQIVRVQEINILTPGQRKSPVSRGREARIFFISIYTDARILCGCLPEYLTGAVL